MTSSLTLDTPHYADYPELAQVWESAVRATHDFLPEPYILLLRDHVLGRYLDAVMLVCCREACGRILGFVGVAGGRVDMLFVGAEHRGQGVGRKLLRHAIEVLGADRLDVNEQNAQALGFYRHEGFEITGRCETDGLGQPYPLLHLQLRDTHR
ncbi:GNAT family N-acetyltransferase [Pseudomonas sp. S75]|uniref:GNAT family N-acetyltransferase n=1 Tax=unclassified Pseudomonas TaxID=196821 RepID=UPI001904B674|nr:MULTISPECIES: GNAT family N-acetyltransferase [unclassified Pseudomonas]MBJ9977785.1 GNAT family N-acetyltransferase [Pseudomonas sp. S30]MBK0155434.1 GNAT family N-acetyltransferase [Pseudomonas sp. S75]